jgi:hypothetical protein
LWWDFRWGSDALRPAAEPRPRLEECQVVAALPILGGSCPVLAVASQARATLA